MITHHEYKGEKLEIKVELAAIGPSNWKYCITMKDRRVIIGYLGTDKYRTAEAAMNQAKKLAEETLDKKS